MPLLRGMCYTLLVPGSVLWCRLKVDRKVMNRIDFQGFHVPDIRHGTSKNGRGIGAGIEGC